MGNRMDTAATDKGNGKEVKFLWTFDIKGYINVAKYDYWSGIVGHDIKRDYSKITFVATEKQYEEFFDKCIANEYSFKVIGIHQDPLPENYESQ